MSLPSPTPTSAPHSIFGITEIVELILLHVPESDLLFKVPRVCKTFRQTIEGSQALQRRAFMLPNHDSQVVQILSPLPGFTSKWFEITRYDSSRIVGHRIKDTLALGLNDRAATELYVDYRVNRRLAQIMASEPTSSLHTLYFCQPPVERVDLIPPRHIAHLFQTTSFENLQGITMMEVIEFVNSSIGPDWEGTWSERFTLACQWEQREG